MENNVVVAVCGGLQRAGIATLRFNMRSVDDDAKLLEANGEDLMDAYAFCGAQGFERVGLVAYSWSSMVAWHVMRSERPPRLAALALVAPPLDAARDAVEGTTGDTFEAFLERHEKPLLICLGEFDEYCRADLVEDAADSVGQG